MDTQSRGEESYGVVNCSRCEHQYVPRLQPKVKHWNFPICPHCLVPDPEALFPMHKNFCICPHCLTQNQDGMIYRLSEGGYPMISVSDGRLCHLYLEDRPHSYPLERRTKSNGRRFISFCYSHARTMRSGESTVTGVILKPRLYRVNLYRQIQDLADALYLELRRSYRLECMYDLTGELYRPPKWFSSVASLWNHPSGAKDPSTSNLHRN